MPPPPPLHCDTVYLLYYHPLPSHALPAHIHKYLCIFSQAPASRHIKFNTLCNCHSQCNCQFNWLWGNCGTTWFETKQRAKLFATSRKLQLKRNQKTEATKRNQISIKIKQITTNAFGYSITRYSYCEFRYLICWIWWYPCMWNNKTKRTKHKREHLPAYKICFFIIYTIRSMNGMAHPKKYI